jgi:hypothetical protein
LAYAADINLLSKICIIKTNTVTPRQASKEVDLEKNAEKPIIYSSLVDRMIFMMTLRSN